MIFFQLFLIFSKIGIVGFVEDMLCSPSSRTTSSQKRAG